VEDGDIPRAVCHEEEIVGLVELSHFHIGVCFKVHCAGKPGNVLVAGLVYHSERVKEGAPGGVKGHGVFYFYEIAMAVDGFGFDKDKRMWWKYDKRIPPGDPGNSSRPPSLRRYPLETHQYPLEKGYPLETHQYSGKRFPPIPSLLLPPNIIT
jgi:hypothetical protein